MKLVPALAAISTFFAAAAPAAASDSFFGCSTASGGVILDGEELRFGGFEEDARTAPFTVLQETTIRDVAGYCTDEAGTQHQFGLRIFVRTVSYEFDGQAGVIDLMCEEAFSGLPANATCVGEDVITSSSGLHVDAAQ